MGKIFNELTLEKRRQDVLFDKKWRKFLKRSRLFQYIPFINFVFGAGSMALGNVHELSDFDVIICVKKGRIFTARFLTAFAFGVFRWRRKNLDHRKMANDKICLNHFFTEEISEPGWPYDDYRRQLYNNLVPIFGEPKKIAVFLNSMEKIGATPPIFKNDLRHYWQKDSFLKNILEKTLAGRIGNFLEKILKNLQVKRIERSFKKISLGAAPRVKYTDDELEFHPHNET